MRHRRVSEANLEVERFGLPNKPTGTPEQLEKLVRCGDWGEFHSPLAPNPEGGNPSVRLDAGQLPCVRGARERCEGRRKEREVFSKKLKKGVDKWTQV